MSDYPSLDELISLSKEKIFLEPIDQYFEDESNNEENLTEGEVYLQKMDDELSKALLLNDNDDISTSMESEDNTNILNKSSESVKKMKVSDFIIINKEKIDKTRKDIINDYYWIIQNMNQKEQ